METYNLVLNSSSSVIFLLVWPLPLILVIVLTPLVRCPLFNKIRRRLVRTFLIGFLIRGFLEEALDLLINAHLNVKQGKTSPDGEAFSLYISLFTLGSLALAVILIQVGLMKWQSSLEKRDGVFCSLYYFLYTP